MEFVLVANILRDPQHWITRASEYFRLQPEIKKSTLEWTNEELESLIELQDDPNDDSQIELRIYFYFTLFKRTNKAQYLELGTQYAEGWWKGTSESHKDKPRRREMFKCLAGRLVLPLTQSGVHDYMGIVVRAATRAGLSFIDVFEKVAFQYPTDPVPVLGLLISLYQAAAATLPTNDPNSVRMYYLIGSCYKNRYELLSSLDDLEKSVEALDNSLRLIKPGYPGRKYIEDDLKDVLSFRAQQKASIADTNRAIKLCNFDKLRHEQGRADLTCISDVLWLVTLLSHRLTLTKDLSLVSEFTNFLRDAASLGPLSDRLRIILSESQVVCSYNPGFRSRNGGDPAPSVLTIPKLLAAATMEGYGGEMSQLNNAIEFVSLSEERSLKPEYKAEALSQTASLLNQRLLHTGASEDLEQGIILAQKSLDLTPEDHPERPHRLLILAEMLYDKIFETRDYTELDRLGDIAEECLLLVDEDHKWYIQAAYQMASLSVLRFRMTGNLEEIDNGIDLMDSLVPQEKLREGFEVITTKMKLAEMLYLRYQCTGKRKDIDRVIEIMDTTPNDPSTDQLRILSLAWSLHGEVLLMRHRDYGSLQDLARATQMLHKAWNCTHTPNIRRFTSGINLANCFAARGKWAPSAAILEAVIDSLTTLAPKSLQTTSKQGLRFHSVANITASMFINAERTPYEGVRVLELGRGIVTGLMMEMRAEVSHLEKSKPELARKFHSAAKVLDPDEGAPNAPYSSVSDAPLVPNEGTGKMRRQAEADLNEVLKEIREQTGFEDFLLPPSEKTLMEEAASGTIVVVNTSPYRCDAFLIKKDNIETVSLPNMTVPEIEKQAEILKRGDESDVWDVLEWLWDVACKPIFQALKIREGPADGKLPHIWWIPTGPLTKLPLHAAGRHLNGEGETVMDRVISSYSLSIKALVHGRRKRIPTVEDLPHAVLVPMRKTPGEVELPYAQKEVDNIETLFPKLDMKPIRPDRQRDSVLSSLSTCRVFHFAGHGSFNVSDPSKSSLLLEDYMTAPLTVEKVWQQKIQAKPPFLAYLSACSTGANDKIEYNDEGINLINAFQLAGFRHVIGTLWEVNDEYCVKVAKGFYDSMIENGLSDEAVATGLHNAMRALREESVENSDLRKSNHRGQVNGTKNLTGSSAYSRNAKVVRSEELKPSFHWLPYVHFGV
ncbi:hypothetical protein TWF694_011750 [Orbilia ellipsospora]|uniref:CHAT domain-containing protein n=1 Tax=Orbilia ellipsospora TaxID=2528407 RepID=A0AAV9X6J5_9PEZI